MARKPPRFLHSFLPGLPAQSFGLEGEYNYWQIIAMPLYALTIFTGAFLLFLVQPLIGKYILPWFGGAPAVWTTCMLFFQLLLLCGYAYAYASARWLKPRVQALVHLLLLLAAMVLLRNIIPSDSWKPAPGEDPTLRILGLLLASIGLPYFVLASTSPLMQHWFSRTNPGVSPFRLYALSNIGSMLALISFPVYFETRFTRPMQAHLWEGGLVLFAICCGCCVWKLWRTPPTEKAAPAGKTKTAASAVATPALVQKTLWLLLPACASTLLLATTNLMCQEVAVIPFLWVLPLALYLLSFIICFDSPRWYVRLPFAAALAAALGGICWALYKGTDASTSLQLIIYSGGLFVCCMVCHGELYRLRPDPGHLTGFYLMIAAGGALGGIFVAVVAPVIFKNYYELQWGLLLCGALFLYVIGRERMVAAGTDKKQRKRAGTNQSWRNLALAGGWTGLAALAAAFWIQAHHFATEKVEKLRNFYGVLTVFKYDNDESDMHYLQFSHGATLHGMQFTDPQRAQWPTTYYSESSGIGLAMRALPAGDRRIGLIGLGIGTLAAYAQPGDYMRFYEINPEVLRIAKSRFTYLSACKGKVDLVLGDARLSLEREPPQNFDLLVVDAFTSDAIPVHLLTKEAFEIYARHLKTNGVIAVHISNKRINLEPVLANIARLDGYRMVTIDKLPPANKPWIIGSVWVLLSRNDAFINTPDIQLASRPPLNDLTVPLWTDDFASLYQILRSDPVAQKDPEFTEAQSKAAFAFYRQGDFAGAIDTFRHALKTLPRSPVLLSNLAFLLTTCPDQSLRNIPEATRLAEEACQLTHYNNPDFLSALAVVYSETDRFPEAIFMAEKACALGTDSGEQALVHKNQQLLVLYRNHQPYHDLAQ